MPQPRRAQVSSADRSSDQALAEADQTSADSDQTLANADQTIADADQASADDDRRAADRDQAASDRDLAAGIDPHEHRISREIRQRTTKLREQTARARLAAAHQRDAIAQARDLAALARDHAATARDQMMAQHDATHEGATASVDFGVEILMRAAEHRTRASEFRALAAEHRTLAAEDRRAAAEDRARAAEERGHALADRELLAAQLALAETDPLTGVRTRQAGLTELEHELDRCRRTNSSLVIVYVDVVGLKELNDTLGHAAGDELLRHVARLVSTHLRSYDLVVRLGGDEFLCAISNTPEADVRTRFSVIAADLAATPDGRAIRTGFTTMRGGEPVAALIARADAELLRGPRHPRSTGPEPHDQTTADT